MDGEELRWTACGGGNGIMDFKDLETIKEILDKDNQSYSLNISLSDTETITLTKKKAEEDKKNPVGFA